VPFSTLREALPTETKWLSANERRQQRVERAAAYRRRLPED
jgi:hypothetical protein